MSGELTRSCFTGQEGCPSTRVENGQEEEGSWDCAGLGGRCLKVSNSCSLPCSYPGRLAERRLGWDWPRM